MSDMKEILAALRKPFPPEHIEWKPQSKSKDGTQASAAAFVDVRRYQDRLDEADPNWTATYKFLKDDASMVLCDLTVGGVTRSDIGAKDEGGMNVETSTIAQAFKRAATAFGLGRDLYFLPMQWVPINEYGKFKHTPIIPAWYLDKCGGKGEYKTTDAVVEAAKGIFGEKAEPDEPEPVPAQQKGVPTFAEWVKDDTNRKSWWGEVKKLGYDEAGMKNRLGVEHLSEVQGSIDDVWKRLSSYCAIHDCEMQERTNRTDGSKWFSHKLEDNTYCNGKKKT